MNYNEIYDLSTLNEYYLQEVTRLVEADVLPEKYFYKILNKILNRFFKNYVALPENKFMLRSVRRKMFTDNFNRMLGLYQQIEDTKTDVSVDKPVDNSVAVKVVEQAVTTNDSTTA